MKLGFAEFLIFFGAGLRGSFVTWLSTLPLLDKERWRPKGVGEVLP